MGGVSFLFQLRSSQIQVSVILLVVLATVIISEWVSAKIRHSII